MLLACMSIKLYGKISGKIGCFDMQQVFKKKLLLPPFLFSFLVCDVGTVHNIRQITNLHLIYKTKYSHE